MDAMWYEAYYFYSADYLNSGTGLSLISSYLTFPFLPTLITRSMISFNPEVGPITLAIVVLLNIVGYVIYRYKSPLSDSIRHSCCHPRSSETVRCELAKDPESKVDGIQTEDGTGGRKLIVSGGVKSFFAILRLITFLVKGWGSVVRHPNYTGEILVQWTWVLPLRECCPYFEDLS